MEENNENGLEVKNQNLLNAMKKAIKTTSTWYMVFGVLQCLGALILLIVLIAFFSSRVNVPVMVILFYLVLLVLNIMMAVSLFRASSSGKIAAVTDDEESMLGFLEQTSNYWKYYGIMLIFTVVMVIVTVAQGAEAASKMPL